MKNPKIYTFANPAILILRFYYKEIVMNMCSELALVIFRAVPFIILKIAYHLTSKRILVKHNMVYT